MSNLGTKCLKFTWKTKNWLNKDNGFVKSAVQPEYFLHYKHVYVLYSLLDVCSRKLLIFKQFNKNAFIFQVA